MVAIGFAFIFLLIIFRSTESPRHKEGEKLRILQQFRIPIREISGMSKAGDKIILIGDDNPVLGVLSFTGSKLEVLRTTNFVDALWEKFFLCPEIQNTVCRSLSHIITREWEAIYYHPKTAAISVLQESTGSIFVFDNEMQKILSHVLLNFFPEGGKRSAKTNNSLGEGFLPLKNGRILVAKEKFPAAVIEFGPTGESPYGYQPQFPSDGSESRSARQVLQPLHYWHLNSSSKHCDLSDITTDRAGTLYGVSQVCRHIYEFANLSPQTARLEVVRQWKIPKRVASPEAMIVINKGAFLVASDTKQKKKDNVFLVADKEFYHAAKVSIDTTRP